MMGSAIDHNAQHSATDHDSILKRHSSQLQRLKKLRRMRTIWLRVGSCAGRRRLLGGEIADALRCLIFHCLVRGILLFAFLDVVMAGHCCF